MDLCRGLNQGRMPKQHLKWYGVIKQGYLSWKVNHCSELCINTQQIHIVVFIYTTRYIYICSINDFTFLHCQSEFSFVTLIQ